MGAPTLDNVTRCFDESLDVIGRAGEHLADRIVAATGVLVEALRADGGVYLFGNGGSAADAQHIAGELLGRFLVDRKPFRAETLTTDTSTMTAIGNDFGFEHVFARQLEGKGRAGDVAWGISTSGNSANVVAALDIARRMEMKTIAMTGDGGGQCAALADVLLDVPSSLTPRIQEAHVVIYHAICQQVEAAMVS
ncbi:hypothetical protein LCGC14_0181540 [marine sediment metagenome]|uniref:D-sedoheptulose-7-phosphate isomerase n=1 Tax=marine sediment metagenome TaxID=412755 RepID=A0A0F9X7Z0_9ZZZZ|nr:SIS domain-containing protein [Phycisphaerae bacterium]HDZ44410.1 SIS domain-containing protein [Phycisphaerae bacterium]